MHGKDRDSSKQYSEYRPLAVLTHALAVLTHALAVLTHALAELTHDSVGFPPLGVSKMLGALRMLRRFTS
jgi:hypothetical protein